MPATRCMTVSEVSHSGIKRWTEFRDVEADPAEDRSAWGELKRDCCPSRPDLERKAQAGDEVSSRVVSGAEHHSLEHAAELARTAKIVVEGIFLDDFRRSRNWDDVLGRLV